MKNKINVAELLKDCPKGMKLDCSMYDDAELDSVDNNEKATFPIRVRRKDGNFITLTKYGQYIYESWAKCVIFPLGKTTWEGFVPPCNFKDGDIVFYNNTIAIFKEWGDETLFRTYVVTYLHCDSFIDVNVPLFGKSVRKEIRLATEEEKQKLFRAIKENGCEWNAETKTLEVIVPKFKDGDIVVTSLGNIAIVSHKICSNIYRTHCFFYKPNARIFATGDSVGAERLATEEEKETLFQAIKENGYKWNKETKTLEKLVEPKFKVGDRIRLKENHNYIYTITGIREEENKYGCGVTFVLKFSEQDNWELVPNKFDITTLKPFESRVLVRDGNNDEWRGHFFSHHYKGSDRPYICIGQEGLSEYRFCIPFEGNEYLLGKTEDCIEFYKTWK